jgi:hypothetical protein
MLSFQYDLKRWCHSEVIFKSFVLPHFSISCYGCDFSNKIYKSSSIFYGYGNNLNKYCSHNTRMKNNNYSNKSWRLGLISARNTITLYLFSMRIIPYSFASYLGHCSCCIALYDTSYQPIWYSIPKNHIV